jgi:hypothetical protein
MLRLNSRFEDDSYHNMLFEGSIDMRKHMLSFVVFVLTITLILLINFPIYTANAAATYPISGKVTDYYSGMPLANITVRWVSGGLWSINSGLTNSKGFYKFDVMEGRQYIDAYDFKNEEYVGGILKSDRTVVPWYIFLVDRSKARIINVNGTVSGLNIKLKPGYEITGTITDASGNPVSKWKVDIRVNDHGTWYYANTIQAGGTGSKGNQFNTSAFPGGTRVELKVQAAGYKSLTYDFNTSTTAIDPIPISSKDVSIKVILSSIR